jgi:TatD DNase family protein
MDSHMHLDRFPPEEREAVWERARSAGIQMLVSVATSLRNEDGLRAIFEAHRGQIFWSVGVHPLELGTAAPLDGEILDAIEKTGPIAVGETGFDYFSLPRGSGAARTVVDVQREAFLVQARVARERNLPLIIHCREKERARRDAWNVLRWALKRVQFPMEKALLHCFDYGMEELVAWQGEGGVTSFSGSVTREDRDDAQKALQCTRMNQILLETDAPFLLPEPLRTESPNGRCEPMHMLYTVSHAARLLGLEQEDMLKLSLENGTKFFGLKR